MSGLWLGNYLMVVGFWSHDPETGIPALVFPYLQGVDYIVVAYQFDQVDPFHFVLPFRD